MVAAVSLLVPVLAVVAAAVFLLVALWMSLLLVASCKQDFRKSSSGSHSSSHSSSRYVYECGAEAVDCKLEIRTQLIVDSAAFWCPVSSIFWFAPHARGQPFVAHPARHGCCSFVSTTAVVNKPIGHNSCFTMVMTNCFCAQ